MIGCSTHKEMLTAGDVDTDQRTLHGTAATSVWNSKVGPVGAGGIELEIVGHLQHLGLEPNLLGQLAVGFVRLGAGGVDDGHKDIGDLGLAIARHGARPRLGSLPVHALSGRVVEALLGRAADGALLVVGVALGRAVGGAWRLLVVSRPSVVLPALSWIAPVIARYGIHWLPASRHSWPGLLASSRAWGIPRLRATVPLALAYRAEAPALCQAQPFLRRRASATRPCGAALYLSLAVW